MPRKRRMEKAGFYHIINRGVAKTKIYLNDEDHQKFLEIVQDASTEYRFEIYSFCLMSNHYHLLLKTEHENLSSLLQKINSRYSIYFNNKYKRVGPLWQGRFKSWYVYDESYLKAVVKYIELNPVKAKITKKIGEYKWAMSSKNVVPQGHFLTGQFSMLYPKAFPAVNFELVENTDFADDLNEEEQKKVDEIFSGKLEIKENEIKPKKLKPLEAFFDTSPHREAAIINAIKEGYKQSTIAKYLNLSPVAISKIATRYKQKVKLFNRLRDKGIFWSYSKEMTFEEAGEKLTIEYILKYGDFDDIVSCIHLFGKKRTKAAWNERLKSNKQFIKTNLMIARVFFGMDVESDYFKGMKNERLEKLRMLAS
jgi:REP element-mobilizing transposase RayT/predicted transcriptional regulator